MAGRTGFVVESTAVPPPKENPPPPPPPKLRVGGTTLLDVGLIPPPRVIPEFAVDVIVGWGVPVDNPNPLAAVTAVVVENDNPPVVLPPPPKPPRDRFKVDGVILAGGADVPRLEVSVGLLPASRPVDPTPNDVVCGVDVGAPEKLNPPGFGVAIDAGVATPKPTLGTVPVAPERLKPTKQIKMSYHQY